MATHDARVCPECGVVFAPPATTFGAKAAAQKTCSRACGTRRAVKMRRSYTARFRQQHSGASPNPLLCQCTRCQAKRGVPDLELRARVAAEMGVGVSDRPRKNRNKVEFDDWQRNNREQRKLEDGRLWG